MKTDQSCILCYHDVELEIYFTIVKATPGTRDPGGNMIDPPSAASIDISGIYVLSKSSDVYDLLQSFDKDELTDLIFESFDQSEDAPESEEYHGNCD